MNKKKPKKWNLMTREEKIARLNYLIDRDENDPRLQAKTRRIRVNSYKDQLAILLSN